MSHLWPEGKLITVTINEANLPEQLAWQGRTHEVAVIANQWIIDDAWWQERVWRHYFKLSTTSGFLLIIYRDLVRQTWYLQRLYD
jgi:hypothetical protein